jgi:hypothetical protein
MPNTSANNFKRCTSCRERKPISAFATKYRRICEACCAHRNQANAEAWARAAEYLPQVEKARAAQLAAQTSDHERVRAWAVAREYQMPDVVIAQGVTPDEWALQSGETHPPGLTITRTGYNKYQRERARAKAAQRAEEKLRERERLGIPPMIAPPANYTRAFQPDATKLCRHCKRRLGFQHFSSPRVRICVQCDGPPLNV